MVQGTMKWTSSTREFCSPTPDDGSRDTSVRFSSASASTCTSDGRGESAEMDASAPTTAVTPGGVQSRSPH